MFKLLPAKLGRLKAEHKIEVDGRGRRFDGWGQASASWTDNGLDVSLSFWQAVMSVEMVNRDIIEIELKIEKTQLLGISKIVKKKKNLKFFWRWVVLFTLHGGPVAFTSRQ